MIIFKNKKEMIYAIIAICIILILFIMSIVLILISNKNPIDYSKDKIIIEYGESVPISIKDYVEDKTVVEKSDENLFKVNVKYHDTNEILNVGTYIAEISYKDNKKEVQLQIKDTKLPLFTSFDDTVKVYTDQNVGNKELIDEGYWVAYDYSGDERESAKISIDGKWDNDTVGKYKVKIVATDKNGLKAKKEAVIEVVKKMDNQEDKNNENNKNNDSKKDNDSKSDNISSNENQNNNKNDENKEKTIPDGKTVYIRKYSTLKNPSENSEFAAYSESLTQIYNAYLNNQTALVKIELPSDSDYKKFLKDVSDYMFDISEIYDDWLSSSTVAPSTNQNGENILSLEQQITQKSLDIYYEYLEVENWLKDIGAYSTSEKNVIYRMNKWLVENTTYNADSKAESIAILGILRTKTGNSEGYAKLIKKACEILDVGVEYIEGTINGNSHRWNRVKIADEWYWIDTALNASDKKNRYYLSKTLWNNHKI